MTNVQILLSVAGMLTAQTGIILTVLVLYINAKIDGKIDGINSKIDGKVDGINSKIDGKIDPLSKQVDMLVQYMISHEGKIAQLQERLKDR
jgi:hypothetical protein